MIVTQPREKLWAWMNSRMGIGWTDDFRAIGLVKDGCLVACVGYNGAVGRTCMMHSAIDDPSAISRTFVKAIFEYPFQQLNLLWLFAPVDSSNERAIKLDLHVGFKEINRFKGAALDGSDVVYLAMSRDECRWINGKQKRPRSARLHSSSSDSSCCESAEYAAADDC